MNDDLDLTDFAELAKINTGPAFIIRKDGKFDYRLLFGLPDSPSYAALVHWASTTPNLHAFVRDFHRLQVEYWTWLHALEVKPTRCLDVGCYQRRDWVCEDYQTLGMDTTGTNDVVGDLTDWDSLAPLGQFDLVIATEVIEHTSNPFVAVANVAKLLRPDGVFLASTPFLWPDHHQDTYPDYWRFTTQGWERLLEGWRDVTVKPCAWSRMGKAAYTLLADAECMAQDTEATSGYLVRATRPA